jgi:thiamine-phosphate diphosphorylase
MLICVTNRRLCKDNFLERIAQIASGRPHGIILREKDLPEGDYEALAVQVRDTCARYSVPLITNHNIKTALRLGLTSVQVSMAYLREHREELKSFSELLVSVHSAAEAMEAGEAGASALIAGHIYETDCKKGVSPRGLDFLRAVCSSVSLPVFAIGGITKERVKEVIEAEAMGVCIMSESMTCSCPAGWAESYKR